MAFYIKDLKKMKKKRATIKNHLPEDSVAHDITANLYLPSCWLNLFIWLECCSIQTTMYHV